MRLVQGKGINDMYWGWASENEWNKIVYWKWTHMLYRCYNEDFHKTKKGKTYIGCTVCDRWLTLSNFIEDVRLIEGYDEEKFLNGELHLDKDKKKDENKQKMSEAHKGKFGSEHPNAKKVAQYDKQTNELIKIWNSMMDVQRDLGINRGHISECCKGKRKSAGGFIWRCVEDE